MKQAICLGAGKGTRLLPVTAFVPKPLFPVRGIPNLKRIYDTLQDLSFRHIAVNVCHLKEIIKEYISAYLPCCRVSEEDYLLDTGGGIKRAWEACLDTSKDVLIVNSDIVTNFPFDLLYDYHIASKAVATLVLIDFAPKNNVLINRADKRVIAILGQLDALKMLEEKKLCFTGISCLNPNFFKYFPLKDKFSYIDAIENAISSGETVNYLQIEKDVEGVFWVDIGTVEGYLKAHELVMDYDIDCNNYSAHKNPSYLSNWAYKGDRVITPYGALFSSG